jgi:DNA-binding NarL/FixJ family response regulator
MRLLLVDDSVVMLKALSHEFSTIAGVDIVGQAKDEAEALEFFQSLKPEVVVLDICLKRGSGINVLKIIKKKKPTPIVIMLTAYPCPQFERKCMELGANYFFDKLTDIPKVSQTLRELVDQSKREKSGNHVPKV